MNELSRRQWDTIDRALWDAERDNPRALASIGMSYAVRALLLSDPHAEIRPNFTQQQFTCTYRGIPVSFDPTMPPNELKLIASDGSTIRIVNIGE